MKLKAVSILKFFVVFGFVFPTAFAKAQNTDIPQGIKYIKASESTNKKAKDLLVNMLTKDSTLVLFDSVCIIGPSLWDRYSKKEVLAAIQEGNVTLKVKSYSESLKKEIVENVAAKAIQTSTDFKKLMKLIVADIGPGYTIRKMNRLDMLYYWSVIFFDIQEPVFVIEGKKHKILVNLTNNYKIFWIDEVL